MANRKLVFTSDAKNDLFEIIDYLADTDIEQVKKFLTELRKYQEHIEKNNFIGTKSELDELYMLDFENHAYRIIYFVNDYFVRIIAIFNSAQVSDIIGETLMKIKNSEFIKTR